MKKISAALVSAALALAVLGGTIAPADALGGCGPNRHRGWGGRCVWGGQNQGWCLRRTGHRSVWDGYGHRVCR